MSKHRGVQASTATRRIHIFLIAFIAVALLLRLGLTIFDPEPDDPGLASRLIRYFSYFTIQSNFVALLASLAVVRGADLSTPGQRALRLISLAAITITGLIYVVILSGDYENSGFSQLATLMLHYIGPPLVILGWLVAGPAQRLGFAELPRALIWPTLWIAWTLLHGQLSSWYPYGFIDITEHGLGPVLINIAMIIVFALLLCAVYVGISRLRWRNAAATPAAADS